MILTTDPFLRINDQWIRDSSIDATPIRSDVTHAVVPYGYDYNNNFQTDFYRYIAVDIVTETVFDYPYPCVTEKSLRAISCKRLFLIMGPCGIVNLLRSKGFDTFDDILNHDYDNEPDAHRRFELFVQSVYQLFALPWPTIKNYMVENSHRFDKNFHLLHNLQQVEITAILQKLDHDSRKRSHS